MRAIKRYAVLTPERRARYGLLYSVALDKNYIDVASDSLIRYSAEYYDREGTPIERLKAYYYLGRTQENAQLYDKAILSYLDAAQYADNVDDKYLLALLYSHLGRLY
ncbi:MAG: tetratricopeptide repeat protein, partial [Paraprevotella sp.]|nr:tetratricopeptide repeat protein [Paraprevotella sp.]